MAVAGVHLHQIGPPGSRAAASGFAEAPFEMLSTCHERVHRMLRLLGRLREHLASHGHDEQAAQAARDVMRYFDLAAPLHHQDEELHVFPVLLVQGDAAVQSVVRRLQQDHLAMEQAWPRARALLQAVADAGPAGRFFGPLRRTHPARRRHRLSGRPGSAGWPDAVDHGRGNAGAAHPPAGRPGMIHTAAPAQTDLQVWDARLETGVRTIDLQHRVLFDLLQRLRCADDADRSPGMAGVLHQLKAYAGYHFHYEEAWVQQQTGDHPLTAGHARLHARFERDLAELEARLDAGALAIDAVREFLLRWLIGHILEQDLPMIHTLWARSQRPPGAERRAA